MKRTSYIPLAALIFAAGCSGGTKTPTVVSNDMVVENPNVPENQVFNTAAPVIADNATDNASTNAVANQVASASGPLANESFVASGNEPFWSISADTKRAKLTTPEDQTGKWFPINRSGGDGKVTMKGSLAGKPMTLTIEQKPCQDDMSGAKFPFTSRLSGTLSGGPGNWNGCARRLSDPVPKPE